MNETESLGALIARCGAADTVPVPGSHRGVRYPETRWAMGWFTDEHWKELGGGCLGYYHVTTKQASGTMTVANAQRTKRCLHQEIQAYVEEVVSFST